ncbi:MAG: hypothetical protein PHG85_05895, partial [Candidatus Altiarchaeota archaeon]|nr:hypothetical protein [Candidatus Altiarchaeota archaeon]
EGATEFFLKIRNPSNRVTGGIYMKSPLIATQVRRVYDDTLKSAIRITEGNYGKLREMMEGKLAKLHSGE